MGPGWSLCQPHDRRSSGRGLGMTTVDSWVVEISVRGQDRETHSEARLTEGVELTGQGTARRNPQELEATQDRDEISAARALAGLADKALPTAAGDNRAIT